QDTSDVSDDGHVHTYVLADFGRVDVDVDDLGLRREAGEFAAGAVVHAHADRDHQVRVVNRVVAVHPTMHAEEPKGQLVVLGKAGDAEQRGHHRNPGLLGESPQLIPGTG